MDKNESNNIPAVGPAKRKPLRPIALWFASILFLCAAAYALWSAQTLKTSLYEFTARQNAAVTTTVFNSLVKSYHNDLRTLHLNADAQTVRFDELCQALSAAARVNGYESITTIAPRGEGYINILDSRFSRQLTPKVDYNTVASVYLPADEGGQVLAAALSAVATGKAEVAYSTLKPDDGRTVVISVSKLLDADRNTIGYVLIRSSGGLAARAGSAAVPGVVLSCFLAFWVLLFALAGTVFFLRNRSMNKLYTNSLNADAAKAEPTLPVAEDRQPVATAVSAPEPDPDESAQ